MFVGDLLDVDCDCVRTDCEDLRARPNRVLFTSPFSQITRQLSKWMRRSFDILSILFWHHLPLLQFSTYQFDSLVLKANHSFNILTSNSKMLISISTFLLSSIILWLVYLLWMKTLASSITKKAGCSPPVKYKHFDPFYGLDLLFKKIQHTKAGNLLALDEALFTEYGKTEHTLFFGANHWLTMDPLVIQTVAATSAEKFGNAPTNRKPCGSLLGDGAFTTDGEIWKRSQELLQPLFSRSQVSQLTSLQVHVDRFLEHIPRDGSTVDIQPLTQMLFLDSSTELGSLSPSEL